MLLLAGKINLAVLVFIPEGRVKPFHGYFMVKRKMWTGQRLWQARHLRAALAADRPMGGVEFRLGHWPHWAVAVKTSTHPV